MLELEGDVFISKKLLVLLFFNLFIASFLVVFTQISSNQNKTTKSSASNYNPHLRSNPLGCDLKNYECITDVLRCYNGKPAYDTTCSKALNHPSKPEATPTPEVSSEEPSSTSELENPEPPTNL